jgi:hypothetical protein
MTQYTSFVAVDDAVKTKGEPGEKVNVPVEMPDGVSREAVFGRGDMNRQALNRAARRMSFATNAYPGAANYGRASGIDSKSIGFLAGIGTAALNQSYAMPSPVALKPESKKKEADSKERERPALEESKQLENKDLKLVIIKIKTATLTAKNKKALKDLGATIISQGKEIKISLPANKLKELAKLDFIVSFTELKKE